MTGRTFTLSALVALTQAKAIITNHCSYDVYLWSVPQVGSSFVNSLPLKPGARYEEPWRRGTAATPGVAIKISPKPNGINDGSDEVDFAYSIEKSDPSKIWVDLSPVRGQAFDNNLAFYTCHGPYQTPDVPTRQCDATDEIELVLCDTGRTSPLKDSLSINQIEECYDSHNAPAPPTYDAPSCHTDCDGKPDGQQPGYSPPPRPTPAMPTSKPAPDGYNTPVKPTSNPTPEGYNTPAKPTSTTTPQGYAPPPACTSGAYCPPTKPTSVGPYSPPKYTPSDYYPAPPAPTSEQDCPPSKPTSGEPASGYSAPPKYPDSSKPQGGYYPPPQHPDSDNPTSPTDEPCPTPKYPEWPSMPTEGPYSPPKYPAGHYPPSQTAGQYPPPKYPEGHYPLPKPTGGYYPPPKSQEWPSKPTDGVHPPQHPDGHYPPPKPTGGYYPSPVHPEGPYPPPKPTGGYHPVPQYPGGHYPYPGGHYPSSPPEGEYTSPQHPDGHYPPTKPTGYCPPPKPTGYYPPPKPEHGDYSTPGYPTGHYPTPSYVTDYPAPSPTWYVPHQPYYTPPKQTGYAKPPPGQYASPPKPSYEARQVEDPNHCLARVVYPGRRAALVRGGNNTNIQAKPRTTIPLSTVLQLEAAKHATDARAVNTGAIPSPLCDLFHRHISSEDPCDEATLETEIKDVYPHLCDPEYQAYLTENFKVGCGVVKTTIKKVFPGVDVQATPATVATRPTSTHKREDRDAICRTPICKALRLDEEGCEELEDVLNQMAEFIDSPMDFTSDSDVCDESQVSDKKMSLSLSHGSRKRDGSKVCIEPLCQLLDMNEEQCDEYKDNLEDLYSDEDFTTTTDESDCDSFLSTPRMAAFRPTLATFLRNRTPSVKRPGQEDITNSTIAARHGPKACLYAYCDHDGSGVNCTNAAKMFDSYFRSRGFDYSEVMTDGDDECPNFGLYRKKGRKQLCIQPVCDRLNFDTSDCSDLETDLEGFAYSYNSDFEYLGFTTDDEACIPEPRKN